MINTEKLKHLLVAYRRDFNLPKSDRNNKTHWDEEQYKWKAVKHFQDNWDIDADDFAAMFAEATAKCYNLLNSQNYFPRGMIINFANTDANAVRTMFINLFNESVPVVDRVNHFIEESERIRSTYGAKNWKSHYQNVNSVSTYLWLKYPDKYYIYKYSECKQAAATLESDFKVKKGANAEVLLDFSRFYNEIAAYLAADNETLNMLSAALTPECYADPQFRTLTIDVGFYISRYHSAEETGVSTTTNSRIGVKQLPSSESHERNITKDEWKKYIEEVEFPSHKGCMAMLKGLMELGGEASCKQLSEVYGGHPCSYLGSAVNIGKRA